MLRVKVEKDRLVVEDTKPTPVKARHVFCVTPDGKQVAWYSPTLRNEKEETVFYAAGDWKVASQDILDEVRAQLIGIFRESPADELRDSDLLQEKMRAMLKRYFRKEMGRRPLILPVVWEM